MTDAPKAPPIRGHLALTIRKRASDVYEILVEEFAGPICLLREVRTPRGVRWNIEPVPEWATILDPPGRSPHFQVHEALAYVAQTVLD